MGGGGKSKRHTHHCPKANKGNCRKVDHPTLTIRYCSKHQFYCSIPRLHLHTNKGTGLSQAWSEVISGCRLYLVVGKDAGHKTVRVALAKYLDAVFTLDYNIVDPELKAKIYQEAARKLDIAENEGRSVVTIVVDHQKDNDDAPKFEGVDFGHVKYDHVKTRSVTIANTGRVPATVGFVDRAVESGQPGGVAPPWLKIKFDRPPDKSSKPSASHEHTLHPGDAVNVELTVRVNDLDLVRRLSERTETLEDVLVLRIQNGRDYFLPLRGDWLHSAFGRSTEKLMRMPEGGVRRLQHQRPDDSNHGDEGVKWSTLRKVFQLTETIENLVERALA